MKIVILGKSELKVSEIGFGGIPIIPLDPVAAVAIVKHCFEQGITFFDTANMYGNSEKMIGEALQEVRGKVVIATKTTRRDKTGVAEHIELSLKNLKTDYIDLYQLHNIARDEDLERVMQPDGAMAAIEDAVAAGKIRHVGVTSHKMATAVKACRTGRFTTLQFPFNFIETEPLDELFVVAREQNMGIIAMKPLGGGLLDKASLCFKFLQQYSDVVPIPGISKKEEIDEIIQLYKDPQPLTQADLSEIEALRVEMGRKFCHRCGYCQPCEQGVAISDVLMLRSTVRRIPPPVAVALSQKVMETVSNCTECGECIEKCPYDLEIPKLIREVHEMHSQLST